MEELKCPICGEKTRVWYGNARKDRLCGKHADMLNKGELEIIDENTFKVKGEIIKKENNRPSTTIAAKKETCLICGNHEVTYDHLCETCNITAKACKLQFDKNWKIHEFRDYYFNLRSSIYRMKHFAYVINNCIKLYALANLDKELHNDNALTDRITNDIKDIIEAKKPKQEQEQKDDYSAQDSHKEEIIRTIDGHYVKSPGERQIDDILYDTRIVHCYEKKAPISSDEPTVTADWFIPVTDSRHGIYIEYWGMNTKEYLANKERKREQYKNHNIPLVEIEKDDIFDIQGLTDRLISEINSLAKKHFNIIDFLK